MSIESILNDAVRAGASDVLLSAGAPVIFHVDGELRRHQEDRPLSILNLMLFRFWAFFGDFLFRCWEVNVKGGAFTLFTVNINKASVVLDNTVDRGKTQSRAFHRLLGGKERFEYSLTGGSIHPNPSVLYGNLDVSPRCNR